MGMMSANREGCIQEEEEDEEEQEDTESISLSIEGRY